jgi:nucleoside-diphosphate-sugar epimerase
MPFRAGEIVHTHSRIDKARAELGFEPQMALLAGLRKTWEWFRARAPG